MSLNPFLQDDPEPEAPLEVATEELYEGLCYGGPLDGTVMTSRADRGRKGFLLVDKPNNHCWIYEWDGNDFRVRDGEPMEVQTVGEKNRFRAAEEFNYDVIAAVIVKPRGGDNGNASA